MIRMPAVAGQFYPGNPEALRQQVQQFLASAETTQAAAIGMVAPHAGYPYSGAIAGMAFARVRVPDRVVILGPNHRGVGHPAAVFPDGRWGSPLGESRIDAGLSAAILRECPGMAEDAVAHRFEHSLEVQLPFLQVKAPQVAIVPICLGFAPLPELVAMGEGVARAVRQTGGEVLIVASSDMTHYEPGQTAREKDLRAIDRILALDAEGLFRTVRGERISMCGVVPVVVMLAAARHLGARSASLVHYGNSGDVTGDQSQVVGYAGVIVR